MNKLIRILLMIPFLFINPNYSQKQDTSYLDEPFELRYIKSRLEYYNQQIMNAESEITFQLFLKKFKENE